MHFASIFDSGNSENRAKILTKIQRLAILVIQNGAVIVNKTNRRNGIFPIFLFVFPRRDAAYWRRKTTREIHVCIHLRCAPVVGKSAVSLTKGIQGNMQAVSRLWICKQRCPRGLVSARVCAKVSRALHWRIMRQWVRNLAYRASHPRRMRVLWTITQSRKTFCGVCRNYGKKRMKFSYPLISYTSITYKKKQLKCF